jgi:hypothetical protein
VKGGTVVTIDMLGGIDNVEAIRAALTAHIERHPDQSGVVEFFVDPIDDLLANALANSKDSEEVECCTGRYKHDFASDSKAPDFILVQGGAIILVRMVNPPGGFHQGFVKYRALFTIPWIPSVRKYFLQGMKVRNMLAWKIHLSHYLTLYLLVT